MFFASVGSVWLLGMLPKFFQVLTTLRALKKTEAFFDLSFFILALLEHWSSVDGQSSSDVYFVKDMTIEIVVLRFDRKYPGLFIG